MDRGGKPQLPRAKVTVPDEHADPQGFAGILGFLMLASALIFATAAAASAVIGVQETSQLAPEDIRPGSLVVDGAVVRTTGESIALEFESSWGTFTYRVERTSGYPRQAIEASQLEPSFSALLSGPTRNVRLNGVIDSVEASGSVLGGIFEFSDERARLRLTLENRVAKQGLPIPNLRSIPYGPHWRQTIDVYSKERGGTQPLLVYIHGGGWVGGDKSHVGRIDVPRYLQAGIAVASVNYRRITDAAAFGVYPPVQGPMHDVARAIQVLRHRAAALGVDKTRIAVSGASAGGCTALWVAFMDEIARPESGDEIARESTRVSCAAVYAAQTSLDPHQLRQWVPDIAYGGHAFGFLPRDDKPQSFQRFWASRSRLQREIERYSPFGLVSGDDPAVLLLYGEEHDATHSPAMGAALKERMDRLGVPCQLGVLSRSEINDALAAFVISELTKEPAR